MGGGLQTLTNIVLGLVVVLGTLTIGGFAVEYLASHYLAPHTSVLVVVAVGLSALTLGVLARKWHRLGLWAQTAAVITFLLAQFVANFPRAIWRVLFSPWQRLDSSLLWSGFSLYAVLD
jgi:hypothetical protein